MAETVTPVQLPTLTVNGNSVSPLIEKDEANATHTNNGVVTVDGDATLVFASPDGGEVRYTFNGRNPNLGSPVADGPVVIRYNGDGFSWDDTVVKAKAFWRGRSSEILRVDLKLRNSPSASPLDP